MPSAFLLPVQCIPIWILGLTKPSPLQNKVRKLVQRHRSLQRGLCWCSEHPSLSSTPHTWWEKMNFQRWVGYEGHGVHAKDFDSLTVQFSSVQWLSCVRLFATQWIAARQASLSITNCWSLLKVMSIESVMTSSHLILCHPFLLLPPIPPSIRVFSNESTLHMRWPKYWSFSFGISPSNEPRTDLL